MKEFGVSFAQANALLKGCDIFSSGAGTGVPFHFHGPGFAEVIFGLKVNGSLKCIDLNWVQW